MKWKRELGILKSIEDGYILQEFGSESFGLIGPYQTAHSASLTLASALVVIVFFWFEGSVKKRFLLPILLIGLYFFYILSELRGSVRNRFVQLSMALQGSVRSTMDDLDEEGVSKQQKRKIKQTKNMDNVL